MGWSTGASSGYSEPLGIGCNGWGLGADEGLPHWWLGWPVRVERLGAAFEITTGILSISSFQWN